MILGLFRKSASRKIVEALHGDIVTAVRQPDFYGAYGVADTFDGRFEILALLSTLVVRRLLREPAPASGLAQSLTDALFRTLDDDLREMGVGDLTVPKRIKKLAANLLGRRAAYAQALDQPGETPILAALARNVYGEEPGAAGEPARRLTRYVREAERRLAETPGDVLGRGSAPFPQPASIP